MMVRVIVVIHAENKDADSIYHQPKYGYENGLVEDDIYRLEKPTKALPCHQQGEQGQQDGATETSKCIDLAGAKTEIRIVRMAPRINVRKRVDAKGRRMRRHVESIREQGNRIENDPGRDFYRHHHHGDRDHDQRAHLARTFLILSEGMIVVPGAVGRTLHLRWIAKDC